MKNDGGNAFPDHIDQRATAIIDIPGMSFRDYMITHFTAAWVIALGLRYKSPGATDGAMSSEAIHLATQQADAVLNERKKETDREAPGSL